MEVMAKRGDTRGIRFVQRRTDARQSYADRYRQREAEYLAKHPDFPHENIERTE